ncbi:glucosidase II beta subunit-like-domain-containing protein [Syncephalis fuscata]|nr:glucosidase II beta subunit-like-domain-containing protein [Syncephalis fuscata]
MSLRKGAVIGVIAIASLLVNPPVDVCADKHKASDQPRGVSKSKAALYVAKDGMFACLDGSQIIPFERVNDDYCDCSDGSDEPGTAACPNGVFHCANRWHRPANIPSSRVNDGLCDPRCCDGSDEYDGKVQCPNRCKEIGAAERESRKQLNAVKHEGGRKRLEYIAIGTTAKEEREQKLANLRREELELRAQLEELSAAKERVEAVEQAESETPQARRLQTCKDHNADLERKIDTARGRLSILRGDIDNLLNILKDMKENHNQNYHDMAVTHAISAYDALENQRAARYEPNNDNDLAVSTDNTWIGDEYTDTIPTSSDVVSSVWDTVKSWVGLYSPSVDEILRGVHNGQYPDGDALRSAYNTARLNKESVDYAPDQRFASLDGKCYTLDVHEYTYEVCMFDNVRQKKQGEYSDTDLGRFRGWDLSAPPNDSEAKYRVMRFEEGLQCWDGPQRSVKVELTCGIEEKLLSVEEPEKCVYLMKMTTPAVCPLPTDTDENADTKDDGDSYENGSFKDDIRDEL